MQLRAGLPAEEHPKYIKCCHERSCRGEPVKHRIREHLQDAEKPQSTNAIAVAMDADWHTVNDELEEHYSKDWDAEDLMEWDADENCQ